MTAIPEWVQEAIDSGREVTAEEERKISSCPCWRRRPMQRRLQPGTRCWDRDDRWQELIVVRCLCDEMTYLPNRYLVARLYGGGGDIVVRGRAEIEVER